MHIKKILCKHWLATIIFIASLVFMAIYGNNQYQKQKNPKRTNTEIKFEEQKINPEIKKNEELKIQQTLDQKNKGKDEKIEKNQPNKINPAQGSSPTRQITAQNLITTKIIIGEKEYWLNVPPTSSLYTALNQLNQTGQANFDFKEFSGLGYFVEGINGQKSDTLRGRYWIYYINDAKAQIGISHYLLKQNDIITWKYENQE